VVIKWQVFFWKNYQPEVRKRNLNFPDFFIFFSVCSQKYERMIIDFFNILHIYKFMARFWLNLGWDDCHFVHLLLLTNGRPLWLGLQNKKIPEENTQIPQPACKLQQLQMWELCVLGYLTYSVFFSSLAANYNWLGTCHFSATNYACNAVPSRTLATTYYCVPATHIWQILSKFFFKIWKKTRENLTTLIWIFQNFNNSSSH